MRPVELGRDAHQRRVLSGGVLAAIVVHLAVVAALVWMPRPAPVRVSVAHEGAISAFVNVAAAPAGTSGARPQPKPQPVKRVAAEPVAADEPVSNESGTGDSATVGLAQGGGGGGPVRMSSGDITLLRKVDPVYPPLMRLAGREGTVVLDAVIHPDGTIGDVTVIRAADPVFAQAAVTAVKQWQYAPPGFQAILTVTVIFSIR